MVTPVYRQKGPRALARIFISAEVGIGHERLSITGHKRVDRFQSIDMINHCKFIHPSPSILTINGQTNGFGTKRRAFMKKILMGLILVAWAAGAFGAQGQNGFVFTQPDGVGDKVSAGSDFALEVLGDAWDYDKQTDFEFLFYNMEGVRVANGVLSGRSTNEDPHLFLLPTGYPSAQNIGKKGVRHPIDTSKYTLLTFRMYLSQASSNAKGRMYWFTGDSTDNLAGVGAAFPVKKGWNVYTVDLTQDALEGGWQNQAQVTGLRLDPIDEGSGVDVLIDWARLTSAAAAQSYTLSWDAGDQQSAKVGVFYLDTDTNASNGLLQMVHSGMDVSSAASLSVSTQSLFPDNYYAAVRLGEDYAAMFLSDPWDMNNDADVPDVYGASDTQISGGGPVRHRNGRQFLLLSQRGPQQPH